MTNRASSDFRGKLRLDYCGQETSHSLLSLSLQDRLTVTGSSKALLSPPKTAVMDSMDPSLSKQAPPDNSTNKESKGARKKVSFLVNDKDKVIEELHQYPYSSGDEEDVWWTDDELDQFLTQAMLVAEHYTTKRKDWQNKIKLILKGCAGGKCKEGQPLKLKASDLDFVVDSPARGLELYIHPIFQKNREKAIQGVVKVQSEYNLCEEKKGTKDPELRIKVLRAQSLKLTQTARTMAKAIADADTRAAIDTTKQEEMEADITTTTTTQQEANMNASEEMVKSEELQTPSIELTISEDDDDEKDENDNKAATRPRTRSPCRTNLRAGGLRDLHNSQTLRRGGIRALQDTLAEFVEYET